MTRPKKPNLLAIVGAIIVLIASVVELTFERELTDMRDDALRTRLEGKVDAIWHMMAQEYSKSPENEHGPWERSNFRALSDVFWHPSDISDLESQVRWLQGLRIFTQIAGSIMVLVGTGGKKDP